MDGWEISTFTRVHSPLKTSVNPLMDALRPAMTNERSNSGALAARNVGLNRQHDAVVGAVMRIGQVPGIRVQQCQPAAGRIR